MNCPVNAFPTMTVPPAEVMMRGALMIPVSIFSVVARPLLPLSALSPPIT